MLLDAALSYARHGIPVLPVHTPAPGGWCSCGRPGCERPGKHPRLRHGLTEATTDPHTIERWWHHWPDANVGLRTGVTMDVADVDTAHGRDLLTRLVGDAIAVGPRVRTGGGWHFWFEPLGYGNRVRLMPGVDWRGEGGYVIAPPSRHADGLHYEWEVRPTVELPEAPDALEQLLAGPDPPPFLRAPAIVHPARYAAVALEAETTRVAHAVPGTRNDTLNRAAFALGRLVGADLLDVATVTRELTAAAAWAGLGRAETARTIHSGLTAGIRAPAESSGRRAPPAA
jgi:hypothetical protein